MPTAVQPNLARQTWDNNHGNFKPSGTGPQSLPHGSGAGTAAVAPKAASGPVHRMFRPGAELQVQPQFAHLQFRAGDSLRDVVTLGEFGEPVAQEGCKGSTISLLRVDRPKYTDALDETLGEITATISSEASGWLRAPAPWDPLASAASEPLMPLGGASSGGLTLPLPRPGAAAAAAIAGGAPAWISDPVPRALLSGARPRLQSQLSHVPEQSAGGSGGGCFGIGGELLGQDGLLGLDGSDCFPAAPEAVAGAAVRLRGLDCAAYNAALEDGGTSSIQTRPFGPDSLQPGPADWSRGIKLTDLPTEPAAAATAVPKPELEHGVVGSGCGPWAPGGAVPAPFKPPSGASAIPPQFAHLQFVDGDGSGPPYQPEERPRPGSGFVRPVKPFQLDFARYNAAIQDAEENPNGAPQDLPFAPAPVPSGQLPPALSAQPLLLTSILDPAASCMEVEAPGGSASLGPSTQSAAAPPAKGTPAALKAAPKTSKAASAKRVARYLSEAESGDSDAGAAAGGAEVLSEAPVLSTARYKAADALPPTVPGPVTVQVASRCRGDRGQDASGRKRRKGVTRGAVGTFFPKLYLTGGDCIECDGTLMSRGKFEKLAGTATAKWHVSIKVLPSGMTLGKWLQQHGLPVLQGKPRRRNHQGLIESWANDDEDDAPATATRPCISGLSSMQQSAPAALAGAVEADGESRAPPDDAPSATKPEASTPRWELGRAVPAWGEPENGASVDALFNFLEENGMLEEILEEPEAAEPLAMARSPFEAAVAAAGAAAGAAAAAGGPAVVAAAAAAGGGGGSGGKGRRVPLPLAELDTDGDMQAAATDTPRLGSGLRTQTSLPSPSLDLSGLYVSRYGTITTDATDLWVTAKAPGAGVAAGRAGRVSSHGNCGAGRVISALGRELSGWAQPMALQPAAVGATPRQAMLGRSAPGLPDSAWLASPQQRAAVSQGGSAWPGYTAGVLARPYGLQELEGMAHRTPPRSVQAPQLGALQQGPFPGR